jgi:hypothetical protein
MTMPYTPVQLSPLVNPATGSIGAPGIPFLSISEYKYAPTGVDPKNLHPGGPNQDNDAVLANRVRSATSWVNNHCFGSDPSSAGASLAASLSVESVLTDVKGGSLRLICDYRPIVEVTGIDVGLNPANVQSIGQNVLNSCTILRKTIVVPTYGYSFRSGDYGSPPPAPLVNGYGASVYAVWSYVNGYPHTALVDSVAVGDTSCVVAATNGSGGLWGVYPGITQFRILDGPFTETVSVTAITVGSSTTTLATSAFAYAHTVPLAPDFIPVSALPPDVTLAAEFMTTMLIKTRGARGFVMPSTPGAMPNKQALAQAGALEDWMIAARLLKPYVIHSKSKV